MAFESKPPPTEMELQEKLWIEIIGTIETMYATLADAQVEMERKNADLLRINEVVRNVIGSMINALVVSDRNGRITLTNDACTRSLGYRREDLIGRQLAEFFAPGAPNAICPGSASWDRLQATGALRDLETEVLIAGGQVIPVSINASILSDRSGGMDGVMLVAYDLRPLQKALAQARAEAEESARAYRELKALQAKLIQSEKMSSLGRMAAGVAHEINNPLGAILVYSHLLLEGTPEGQPQRETLRKIVRETVRCKEIVQELLGFSRIPKGGMQILDLNRIARVTLDLVRAQPLFGGVRLDLDLSDTPVRLEGERGLLQQALVNVVVNAAEAMAGRGTIAIRTWMDSSRGSANIRVADTGPGIPAEQLNQLFEPFFTTKEEGHGTGLGLSITYNIVRQHGGTIEAKSRPGEGAEFILSFPLREGEEVGR